MVGTSVPGANWFADAGNLAGRLSRGAAKPVSKFAHPANPGFPATPNVRVCAGAGRNFAPADPSQTRQHPGSPIFCES